MEMKAVKHTCGELRVIEQAKLPVKPTPSSRVEKNVVQRQVKGVVGLYPCKKMFTIFHVTRNGTPIQEDVTEAGRAIFTGNIRN